MIYEKKSHFYIRFVTESYIGSCIVATGVSPTELACGFRLPICLARDGVSAGEDGVVDLLRSLLLSGSYNIADSPERELVKLLVRAF
jgi:hypothetical protein